MNVNSETHHKHNLFRFLLIKQPQATTTSSSCFSADHLRFQPDLLESHQLSCLPVFGFVDNPISACIEGVKTNQFKVCFI